MSLRILFEPRDLWVGAYWNAEADIYRPYVYYTVWICLLPTLPIRVSWRREVESFKKFKRDTADARSSSLRTPLTTEDK